MPNISPDEIADAIAEVIETADGQGVVLTDRRLARSNSELAKVLKSAVDDEDWKGWVISWSSITDQTNENDCIVETTYRFLAIFQHFYSHDYQADLTSDLAFQRAIFAANEALNASRDLGLGNNTVRHQCLISEGEFETDDEDGDSENQKYHGALFSLDVVVTNTY